jgi:phospholipid/cholesterol/gamma-HCH transport system ATP-binding protein
MNPPILQFNDAQFPAPGAAPTIQLLLRCGDALVLQADDTATGNLFADLVCGVQEPRTGSVCFETVDWAAASPDAAALARSRIGRIFSDPAWISNLDVDENVTLAMRHHAKRASTEIQEAAQWLSRQISGAPLPTTRPAWTAAPDLILAQWTRALLGNPPLLLLQHPFRHVRPARRDALVQLVQERRALGAAVIWICSAADSLNIPSLNPTCYATLSAVAWELNT